jgi:hypothetical protein
MIAETDAALRTAIRTVHKSGKFWKDLVIVNAGGLSVASQLQTISLSTVHPRIRQLAYVKKVDTEEYLDPVTIEDQLDHNRMQRQNIFYGVGSNLMIRAASPATDYEIAAYTYPDLAFAGNGTSSTDWIYDEYQELVVLWAAGTVLSLIGEQEIKSRVDQLAQVMFVDLVQDNLEVVGR